MNPGSIVLYQSEYSRIAAILTKIQKELRAQLILLIDRSGQQIASEGPATDVDLTALASLAAANVAATGGLARLVGEPEFSILYHQGKRRSIHISDVSKQFSLVVLFDETVSPGVVRWKVRRATASLDHVLLGFSRTKGTGESSRTSSHSPGRFTDEEIEKLIGRLKPEA